MVVILVLVMLPVVAVKLMVPVPVVSEPDNPSVVPVRSMVPPVVLIVDPPAEVNAPPETALNVLPAPAAELPVKLRALVDVK